MKTSNHFLRLLEFDIWINAPFQCSKYIQELMKFDPHTCRARLPKSILNGHCSIKRASPESQAVFSFVIFSAAAKKAQPGIPAPGRNQATPLLQQTWGPAIAPRQARLPPNSYFRARPV
jgi:hypothetical protein